MFLTFLSSAAAAVSLLPLKPPDRNRNRNRYTKTDTVKALAWLVKENAMLERLDMRGPDKTNCEYSVST